MGVRAVTGSLETSGSTTPMMIRNLASVNSSPPMRSEKACSFSRALASRTAATAMATATQSGSVSTTAPSR